MATDMLAPLPEELLLLVLDYVDPCDLRSVKLANRKYRRLADTLIWSHIEVDLGLVSGGYAGSRLDTLDSDRYHNKHTSSRKDIRGNVLRITRKNLRHICSDIVDGNLAESLLNVGSLRVHAPWSLGPEPLETMALTPVLLASNEQLMAWFMTVVAPNYMPRLSTIMITTSISELAWEPEWVISRFLHIFHNLHQELTFYFHCRQGAIAHQGGSREQQQQQQQQQQLLPPIVKPGRSLFYPFSNLTDLRMRIGCGHCLVTDMDIVLGDVLPDSVERFSMTSTKHNLHFDPDRLVKFTENAASLTTLTFNGYSMITSAASVAMTVPESVTELEVLEYGFPQRSYWHAFGTQLRQLHLTVYNVSSLGLSRCQFNSMVTLTIDDPTPYDERCFEKSPPSLALDSCPYLKQLKFSRCALGYVVEMMERNSCQNLKSLVVLDVVYKPSSQYTGGDTQLLQRLSSTPSTCGIESFILDASRVSNVLVGLVGVKAHKWAGLRWLFLAGPLVEDYKGLIHYVSNVSVHDGVSTVYAKEIYQLDLFGFAAAAP